MFWCSSGSITTRRAWRTCSRVGIVGVVVTALILADRTRSVGGRRAQPGCETDGTMLVEDCERRLLSMLCEAGVEPPRRRGVRRPRVACPRRTWAVFKQFAALPADGRAGGELLVETGVGDFGDGRAFHLTFVRCFTAAGREGERLECRFQFSPDYSLTALEPERLSAGRDEPLTDFFARVERAPGFRAALRKRRRCLRLTVERRTP